MMKMKFKIIVAVAVIGLIGAGCRKEWLAVNKDPNNLTGQVKPSIVFTNALAQTVANEVGQNELGSYWSGQWTQSSSYIFSATTFAYQFTNSNFNYFDPIYNNLEDYQYVIDNADATAQPYYKGPAQIMKAYLFQKLVDMYGDVPYVNALKGLNNLFPTYDNQKTIYESLIPLLDSAIAKIKANSWPGNDNSGDISFAGGLGAGSKTKWIKFANTVKLRILIRQSRIAGRDAYIVPELQKIMQEGTGFLDAGQDMAVNPGYLQTTGKQNPFFDTWGYDPAGTKRSLGRYPRPTKFLFDVLKATNDTFRLKRMAYARGGEGSIAGFSSIAIVNGAYDSTLDKVSSYVGVPYGAPSGYTAPSTSYIGPSVIVKGQYNKPLYLITAAESQFLLAEAAFRYGSQVTFPKTAQQYYEDGVRESFRLLGVTNYLGRANALLTSGLPEADWTASPDKLKAIWTQKWLALVNFGGMEAWAEYRRTNYPNIPLSAGAPTTQPVPVRLYYPNTELGANTNTPAQASNVVFTQKLFWDVD
jgi:hypothetical protein